MKTKICSHCKKEKFLKDFVKDRGSKDGLSYWCKQCKNKVNKKRYHEIRKWVTNYKISKGCKLCGIKHPAVLVFHHTEKKEESISRLISGQCSKKRILEEIEKCDVYCANHHRLLHWNLKLTYIKDNIVKEIYL